MNAYELGISVGRIFIGSVILFTVVVLIWAAAALPRVLM